MKLIEKLSNGFSEVRRMWGQEQPDALVPTCGECKEWYIGPCICFVCLGLTDPINHDDFKRLLTLGLAVEAMPLDSELLHTAHKKMRYPWTYLTLSKRENDIAKYLGGGDSPLKALQAEKVEYETE